MSLSCSVVTCKQRGFTLVELMVALTIGLFITGVIGALYIDMNKGYRYQDHFARLQENGRSAMGLLSRDIRMSGYTSCGAVTTLTNVLNGYATNLFLNFATPVIGFEGGASVFPTLLTNAGAVSGSDAIVVMGVDPLSEVLVQNHNVIAGTITTPTNTFHIGDFLLAADCRHAALFQSSSAIASNVAAGITANTGTPGNCVTLLGGSSCGAGAFYQFKPGSSLTRVYSNAYFVAPSSSGNGRSLWVFGAGAAASSAPAPTELIEGVEGMQITYGTDTDGDRVADQYLTANLVTDWSKVLLVQLSILVKSTKDNLTATPQTENFNGGSVTDRRQQKVFTESVVIRNRTP